MKDRIQIAAEEPASENGRVYNWILIVNNQNQIKAETLYKCFEIYSEKRNLKFDKNIYNKIWVPLIKEQIPKRLHHHLNEPVVDNTWKPIAIEEEPSTIATIAKYGLALGSFIIGVKISGILLGIVLTGVYLYVVNRLTDEE
jgi:hypothetical protein